MDFISCSSILDLLALAPIEPDYRLVTPLPIFDVPPFVYIMNIKINLNFLLLNTYWVHTRPHEITLRRLNKLWERARCLPKWLAAVAGLESSSTWNLTPFRVHCLIHLVWKSFALEHRICDWAVARKSGALRNSCLLASVNHILLIHYFRTLFDDQVVFVESSLIQSIPP